MTDDIILYTEKPKKLAEELLELINQFRYVAGYKIQDQYTTNKLYFCTLAINNLKIKLRTIHRFNVIPINIQVGFFLFIEIVEFILKMTLKGKGFRTAKITLED